MKTTLKAFVLFLLITPLLLNSCKEDNVNIDARLGGKDLRPLELAIPIAKINIELKRWLSEFLGEDAYIKFDENDMISVEYRDSVFLGWEELKEVKDIDSIWVYELSEEGNDKSFYPIFYSFNDSIVLAKQKDAYFDSLTYFTGYLSLSLDLPADMTGSITFTIPEIIEGGKAITYDFDFSPGNNTFSQEKFLKNGKILFKNNHINLNSKITVKNAASNAFPGDYNMKFALKDLDVENAYGYFGKVEVNTSDNNFRFGFFDDLQIFKEFEFGDILLDVKSDNKMGVPIRIETDELFMYLNKGDDFKGKLELNSGEQIAMDVSAATYTKNGKGELSLNNSNSNIAIMGSLFPNKINYGLKGLSNFDNEGVRSNFMGVDSDLKIDLTLEFPLWFRAWLYDRNDTVDFDVSSIFNKDAELAKSIELANLYLDVRNKFPFDVKICAWVIDSANQYVDSLIKYQPFLVSGIPDNSGNINNAEFKEFIISIRGNQLFDYVDKKVKKIVFQTMSTTYNQGQQFIKIFGHTGMDIHVSLDAKVKIQDDIDKHF